MKTELTKSFLVIPVLFIATQLHAADDVWMRLFNGENFTGWSGIDSIWKVEDSTIVGFGEVSHNSFLVYMEQEFSDFVLSLNVRMVDLKGNNSGIQYRSSILDSARMLMQGYQVEVSTSNLGALYGEQYEQIGWNPVGSDCRSAILSEDWNHVLVTAEGNDVKHEINDVTCTEFSEEVGLSRGLIGLQIHNPGGYIINFRDIYIRPLNGSFEIPDTLAYHLDGTPVVSVNSGNGWYAVSPVIAHNQLILAPSFLNNFGNWVSIALINPFGSTIYSRDYDAGHGNPIVMDMSGYGKGMLIMRISAFKGSCSSTLRLVNP